MPKYRLPDEPRPGALARIVVSPQWPLLVSMLGGAWIGWPWFIVNAHAVGSPSKWRQTFLVAGGLLGSAALFVGIVQAIDAGIIHRGAGVELAKLGLLAWKLAISYWLCLLQMRSVELFAYYRGIVRNGFPLVILGAIVRDRLLVGLPTILWIILR